MTTHTVVKVYDPEGLSWEPRTKTAHASDLFCHAYVSGAMCGYPAIGWVVIDQTDRTIDTACQRHYDSAARCPRCGDEQWIDDPTACGDPDHCAPAFACPVCNPGAQY